MPVDLGAFAIFDESEWFYPPGCHFEGKKEVLDTCGQDQETGPKDGT